MADKNLSQVLGSGGGSFVADEIPDYLFLGAGIPAGTIFTVSPPAGKSIKLNRLYSSSDEPGISVIFGSRTIKNSKTLTAFDADATNKFWISGQFPSIAIGSQFNGATGFIQGKADEALTITADANTVTNITIQYEVGS